ncbi:MAG: dihydrodipicolinate synthase family protein [Nitriliruptoraceae bacterium]
MTGTTVLLPRPDRSIEEFELGRTPFAGISAAPPPRSREAFAAPHVVADVLAPGDPTRDVAIDWDATLAYRRHLWSLGFGVAEAMDTAQRGAELPWSVSSELIERSAAEARACGGVIASGVSTDHLDDMGTHHLEDIAAAYELQLEHVQNVGSRVIMMASPALAAVARSAEDYLDVYGRVLRQADDPVIVHWLGKMFDPDLAGYWGSSDPAVAMGTVLELCHRHADVVDGVKFSLLDAEQEVELRRRLPEGVRCYTGDDLAYPGLIRGDEEGYSDALLGVFDPLAPVAAAALQALDEGDTDRYDALLGPTVDLSRLVFEAPTAHFKVGVVFLAFLSGHQDHPRLVGGLESRRSVSHLAELVRRAEAAGVLPDPELAAERAGHIFASAGVGVGRSRAVRRGDHG